MAVQTANTIQSGHSFVAPNWIDESIIIKQQDILLKSYPFQFVKIGLVPNINLLNTMIRSCIKANPSVKIVWDPVLSATAGFNFDQDFKNIENTLKHLYLITPNFEEIKKLSGMETEIEGANALSQFCRVLLKGGHNSAALGKDLLFHRGEVQSFNPKAIKFSPKHGSGCVLASAITANLAKDYPLQKSILRSKRYIEAFLSSNNTLIGTHKP